MDLVDDLATRGAYDFSQPKAANSASITSAVRITPNQGPIRQYCGVDNSERAELVRVFGEQFNAEAYLLGTCTVAIVLIQAPRNGEGRCGGFEGLCMHAASPEAFPTLY